MSQLSRYVGPISSAFLLFIPVAALITLPFLIYQYRRYGSIPILRILVVYGFVLYMMCAYLLTVLPLPTRQAVLALPDKHAQLIPFQTYAQAFSKAGFSLSSPETLMQPALWKKLLTSSALFEILANIVMQIPLGVFLRYYFKRSWKQTLLIGFGVSLFYELTQLSGLYFIYPKAYRLCSVDDLIDNTLGAMLGYGITPILCAVLPSRDALDKLSIKGDRRVTLTRQITALIIDWMVYLVVLTGGLTLLPNGSQFFVFFSLWGYPIWIVTVFVFGQRLFHGQTIGKALLRIRLADRQSHQTPRLHQLMIRYATIYFLLPVVLAVVALTLLLILLVSYSADASFRLLGLISFFVLMGIIAVFTIRLLLRHEDLPHNAWSHTAVFVLPRHQSVISSADSHPNE